MKENKTSVQRLVVGEWLLIADSRLDELRALTSSRFDFRKLIRLCEELNTAYQQGCYFATAMLTRGLLDPVPPIFGKKTFDEVASNYGGSRSWEQCSIFTMRPGTSPMGICINRCARARHCVLPSR